jgi:hypothetical protein
LSKDRLLGLLEEKPQIFRVEEFFFFFFFLMWKPTMDALSSTAVGVLQRSWQALSIQGVADWRVIPPSKVLARPHLEFSEPGKTLFHIQLWLLHLF